MLAAACQEGLYRNAAGFCVSGVDPNAHSAAGAVIAVVLVLAPIVTVGLFLWLMAQRANDRKKVMG